VILASGTPRPALRAQPAARKLTMAEQIESQIDRLYQLRSIAANERRPHRDTEQLIDGLDETGRILRRIARG
jgi:hypothetical protein